MKSLIVVSFLVAQMAHLAIAGETVEGMVEGMKNVQSKFSVQETADRLEKIFIKKGVTIFNRIKHSDAAEKVGVKIGETELFVFGNPKLGSPLMKCKQSMAIDLPQKALVWQDDKHKVWISYNDIRYIAKRHHLAGCDAMVAKIEKVLAKLTNAAAHVAKKTAE